MSRKKNLFRTSVLLSGLILAGCSDETKQVVQKSNRAELTTLIQGATPEEFYFEPISKVNCDGVHKYLGTPVRDYFDAVGQSEVDIDSAENALLRIHRQLRCISASNLSDVDNACSSLILCQGTETGSVNNNSCTCSARTMEPGLSFADQCSSAMLCTQNQNTCGCQGPNENLDVPSAGGLPDDGELYLRVGFEHSQHL